MNVDPKALTWPFLNDVITRTYHGNAMHNFKD
jgi:hypothetical protein